MTDTVTVPETETLTPTVVMEPPMTVVNTTRTEWKHSAGITKEIFDELNKLRLMMTACHEHGGCYLVDSKAMKEIFAKDLPEKLKNFTLKDDWTIGIKEPSFMEKIKDGDLKKIKVVEYIDIKEHRTPFSCPEQTKEVLKEVDNFLQKEKDTPNLEVCILNGKTSEKYGLEVEDPNICRVFFGGYPKGFGRTRAPLKYGTEQAFNGEYYELHAADGTHSIPPLVEDCVKICSDEGVVIAQVFPKAIVWLNFAYYCKQYSNIRLIQDVLKKAIVYASQNLEEIKAHINKEKREKLLKIFKTNLSKKLDTKRRELESLKGNIESYHKSIAAYEAQMLECLIELQAYENSTMARDKEAEEAINIIATMPMIKDIEERGGYIIVATDVIKIKNTPLGEFEIKIGGGDIDIVNKTPIDRGGNPYHHPHISPAYRGICWGNSRELAIKMLTACDFGKLIPFLIAFLQTYHEKKEPYEGVFKQFRERHSLSKKEEKADVK
jgi:hypothetical protein